MSEYRLEMKSICKSFYHVPVLQDVDFCVLPGEVHALLGENGAGKSTLMKILAGIYKKDSGQIFINGSECDIKNPAEAQQHEISFMHQEISVAPDMTVAENIALGVFPTKGVFNFLDRKTMNRNAEEVLKRLHMSINAEDKVGHLSIAQQQMVEIARAISLNAKIIVMDEPTAALTETEVDGLLEQIRILKSQNISIVYISHRMEEIYRICDRITILRDGKYIVTKKVADVTNDEVISYMVGRSVSNIYAERHVLDGGEVVLEARGLKNKYLKNISFKLHRGEILGFSGLVGAGRTELSRALFGIDALEEGEILVEGNPVRLRHPQDAIDLGIALVPEDRKAYGILQDKSVSYNLTLAIAKNFVHNFKVDKKAEKAIADKYQNALSIKMNSAEDLCRSLSGGNQQKVVISKWLATEPKILILDEPTRGIDVGAKMEIYHLINELADQGISIIMISSELPEVLHLSNNIAVMHEGKLVVMLDDSDGHVTQEEIMYYAMGGTDHEN